MVSGARIDLSGYCDGVVTITADSNANTANGDCLKFAVYGNNGS